MGLCPMHVTSFIICRLLKTQNNNQTRMHPQRQITTTATTPIWDSPNFLLKKLIEQCAMNSFVSATHCARDVGYWKPPAIGI